MAFFAPSFARRGAPETSTSTSVPIPLSASRISWRCSRNRGFPSSSVMAVTDSTPTRLVKNVEVDPQSRGAGSTTPCQVTGPIVEFGDGVRVVAMVLTPTLFAQLSRAGEAWGYSALCDGGLTPRNCRASFGSLSLRNLQVSAVSWDRYSRARCAGRYRCAARSFQGMLG
jgi:hypothetical protein